MPAWWQAVRSTAPRLLEPGVGKMRGELTVLAFCEFSLNEQPQAFFKREILERQRNGALEGLTCK